MRRFSIGMAGVAMGVMGVLAGPLAGAANAQTLKHEKYVLPNGMTVLLQEDHALPVATINLWYRVGARNEPPHRSGFAHLFEHLMFMGTKRVPGSDFDNLMEAGGGANNASTSLDRTNYFSWGPSSLLPTLLYLDADRLEDLGPQMTTEKLNLQRDVVRNEIRQQVENSPYGRAYESSYLLMYPPEHPYQKGVYGTHEDLEAATVLDVKDFFSTFYAPDNCSIVVAGDFDSATVKPMIAGLFGTLPRGKPPTPAKVTPPKLDREIRQTMLDKVQLPKISMCFHSPGLYAEGDAETNLLGAILADGKAGRLYQRLVVKDQKAVSVTASQDGARLGSIFRVEVLTKPDADLASVEAALDEELERIVKDGPSAEELAPRASSAEAALLSSMESLRTRADKLNEYEFYWGNPDSLQRDIERYRKATVGGVQATAAKVLTKNACLVQWILPEERERPQAARDQRPAAMVQKAFVPPAATEFKLNNGVRVQIWTRSELPLVAATVVISPRADDRTKGRPTTGFIDSVGHAGYAALFASMLQEGAGDRPGPVFAQAMSSLGGSMVAVSDYESVQVSTQVLARNFDAAIDLLADAVLRPQMKSEDFERVKAIRLDEIRQQAEEPAVVAQRVSARLLLGDSNPYSAPTIGTIESVSKLKLDDLWALKESFGPGSITVFIAGDVSAEAATAAIERAFGTLRYGPTQLPTADLNVPKSDGLRFYIVDRPGAVQTVLRLMAPGVKYADPRRVPLEMVNTILGGSFTSRLNRNLREVHGFTYGASSRISVHAATGFVGAQSSVKADVTGPALKEFLGELTRISSGDISAEEIGKARETIRNDAAQSFGTLAGVLGNATELSGFGATLADLSKDLAAMQSVDSATLTAVAKETFRLDRAVLVLVGDKGLILQQTKDLGLPTPIFVDEAGLPVKGNTEGGR